MICFFQVHVVCCVLDGFIQFSMEVYEQLKRFSASEMPKPKVMRLN